MSELKMAKDLQEWYDTCLETRTEDEYSHRLCCIIERIDAAETALAAANATIERLSAPVSEGVSLIAAERKRQIDAEGWTAEHDAKHAHGEMAEAGACYAGLAGLQERIGVYAQPYRQPERWPWHSSWWKPSETPLRNLEKAGALIAAAIDRIIASRKAAQEAK